MTIPAHRLALGDYRVNCHNCPPDAVLMRSKATLHGVPFKGALWHCPEHAEICTTLAGTTCPHGSWCDDDCHATTKRLPA